MFALHSYRIIKFLKQEKGPKLYHFLVAKDIKKDSISLVTVNILVGIGVSLMLGCILLMFLVVTSCILYCGCSLAAKQRKQEKGSYNGSLQQYVCTQI